MTMSSRAETTPDVPDAAPEAPASDSAPEAPASDGGNEAAPATTSGSAAAPAAEGAAPPAADTSAANLASGTGANSGKDLSDFRQALQASGNILGGVPVKQDTNPAAILFSLYLVFIAVLGLRALLRKTSSSVDFRVFCFLIVRVATFGIRFGISEDKAGDPERGSIIAEGVLLLVGPLLLISALLTIILNIATPTLDALKARADVERSTEGTSRRPGGAATFFLKHLPTIFQGIIGICAVLTTITGFRMRKALDGQHKAQMQVRVMKGVTTFALLLVTLVSLMIIMALWAKLAAVGKSETALANGRVRRGKGYKTQTALATIIGLALGVAMMYRMIQAHAKLDSHVNKYKLFWLVYVLPETFATLIFVLYCFPQLPQEEVIIIPSMPGPAPAGTGAGLGAAPASYDKEDAAPPMRQNRNFSVASNASTARSSSASSIKYVK